MKKNKEFDIIVTLNSVKLEERKILGYLEAGVTIFRLNGSFLLTSEIKKSSQLSDN